MSKQTNPTSGDEFHIQTELYDICQLTSPSNHEGPVVEYLQNRTKSWSIYKQIVSKKKSFVLHYDGGHKETVLLDAHIDQVHLRILRVIDDGTVLALPVGFGTQIMDGNSVLHIKSNTVGTVVTVPPHLNISSPHTDSGRRKPVLIDFGITKQEVETIMTVGDPIVFRFDFYTMNPNLIVSRALDNKAGVVSLLYVAHYFQQHPEKLHYNLLFHFSPREETGLGSIGFLLKKNLHPDYIIVVDTDIATDSTVIPKDMIGLIALGKGPVITRNYDDDIEFGNYIMNIANQQKIPFQVIFSSSVGGSNNQAYSTYLDTYTQFVGIPLRNMHSPLEVIHKKDIEWTSKLLWTTLSTEIVV